MTTLTKEELDIDSQEAPVDNLGEDGIKIHGMITPKHRKKH